MTTMITEVYDALKSAGADEEKARAAAEAIATHQRDTTELRTEMRTEFSDIRGELKRLKWMLGLVLAGIASLVIKTFVAGRSSVRVVVAAQHPSQDPVHCPTKLSRFGPPTCVLNRPRWVGDESDQCARLTAEVRRCVEAIGVGVTACVPRRRDPLRGWSAVARWTTRRALTRQAASCRSSQQADSRCGVSGDPLDASGDREAPVPLRLVSRPSTSGPCRAMARASASGVASMAPSPESTTPSTLPRGARANERINST